MVETMAQIVNLDPTFSLEQRHFLCNVAASPGTSEPVMRMRICRGKIMPACPPLSDSRLFA